MHYQLKAWYLLKVNVCLLWLQLEDQCSIWYSFFLKQLCFQSKIVKQFALADLILQLYDKMTICCTNLKARRIFYYISEVQLVSNLEKVLLFSKQLQRCSCNNVHALKQSLIYSHSMESRQAIDKFRQLINHALLQFF